MMFSVPWKFTGQKKSCRLARTWIGDSILADRL